MAAVIRPILLVPNKTISVEYKDTTSPNYMGTVAHDGSAFRITIERKLCLQNYIKSWLQNKVTFDEFLCGVLLHEVAHIKYDTFNYYHAENDRNRDSVWEYIDNVLEDARIEYKLSFEHPNYSQYLRWLLAALKVDIDISKAQKTTAAADAEKVQKYLRQLFVMARFGLIEDDYDPAFTRLALPLVYSAMRGERENAVRAVDIIYDYLSTKVNMDAVAKYAQMVTIILTTDQVNELLNRAGRADNGETANGIFRVIVEGGQQNRPLRDGSDQQQYGGRLAGSGDNELIIEDKDNAFYRSTIESYQDVIGRLRRVFKRLFESVKFDRDYDGEIDMRFQQNIYLNSFSNDCPTKDYQRISRVNRDLDVAVVRDVSGSTGHVKDEYAAAVVCLLASLEGLSHVRSALVDFSERHRVAKRFDAMLRTAAIYPVSDGGTTIGTALREIEGWQWKAKNRLVLVITDGEISDNESCAQRMRAMAKTHGIKFHLIDIGAASGGSQSVSGVELTRSTIEELPETIAAKILRKVEEK